MTTMMTKRAEATQRAVLVVAAFALTVSMTPNWTTTVPASPTIDHPPSPAAALLGGRAVFSVTGGDLRSLSVAQRRG
jgi:hypothetical protein